MLFIVDDLADDRRTMGCQLIRELLLRGRHSWISTILSTQKMRAIDHACRLQFTGIFQFRVRSKRDWEVILEEYTSTIDPKILQEMYEIATSDEYGFLFLNLQQNRFFRSFRSELKFQWFFILPNVKLSNVKCRERSLWIPTETKLLTTAPHHQNRPLQSGIELPYDISR